MHPTKGACNLATMLPDYTIPPDLGPKAYIAYGREREHEGEGDSVTKLHEDLSDAINILCHVQHREDGDPATVRCGEGQGWEQPGYGGAGAVWDLVRREDMPTLRRFLTEMVAGLVPECPPFYHKGVLVTPETVIDVIHDQCFMLTEAHRDALRSRFGVHPWHFEQFEWEGVLIPAACGHQVRNLRSCIKVALDFVSPQSVRECLGLRSEFRALAIKEKPAVEEDPADRHFHDKLQVSNMLLYGMLNSLRVIKKHFDEGEGKEAKRGRKRA
jgi:[histone H3]-dimethyl-L-lysine9 demethylase